MKSLRILACLLAVVVQPSFLNEASADVVTYTASADPNANPDAVGGANVWTVTRTSGDLGQNGSFSGNSGSNGDGSGAGAGSPAWALYANSGQIASAAATFSTIGSSVLASATEYVSLSFDNGYIDSGGTTGIEFLDSADVLAARFRFTAGGTNEYRIDDFVNNFGTSIPFTDDGLNVQLTLNNSAGGYSLIVGAATFSSRTLMNNVLSIAKIRVYNEHAGGGDDRNLYFNTLQISTVPEISPLFAWPILAAAAGVGGRVLRRRRCRSR